jgi:hypothetical protein
MESQWSQKEYKHNFATEPNSGFEPYNETCECLQKKNINNNIPLSNNVK